MDIPEILKRFIEEHVQIIELHGAGCDHDEADTGWSQVARLGQEDILKRKAHVADLNRARSEMEVLMAKLDAIKARAIADKTEYWANIRSKYGLPAKGALRISDDHRIMFKDEGAKQ